MIRTALTIECARTTKLRTIERNLKIECARTTKLPNLGRRTKFGASKLGRVRLMHKIKS